MTARPCVPTVKDRIEQGIARGDSPERIARLVPCSLATVHAVRRDMDVANYEPDVAAADRAKT